MSYGVLLDRTAGSYDTSLQPDGFGDWFFLAGAFILSIEEGPPCLIRSVLVSPFVLILCFCLVCLCPMRLQTIHMAQRTRLANEMDLEPDSFLRVLLSVYRRDPAVFDPC